jgi:hypothetical protein
MLTFVQMIIVATPHKPFQYGEKGLPRRPFVLKEYQPEIDSAYSR